ncbi:Protein of unknown function [Polaromonas sp. OV174]|uniref:DUF1631 family protein n=1 Tax=Polaromonas sp. OV174 TaxID=1855300 RepID=UPI0008DEFAB0|nr:DUF1631 family protein [Polaromonas sp. OV174]SFC30184.1 Protein of unknown function [Polaromonas sp. OV174]
MAPSNQKNSLIVEQARALFTERIARLLPELAKAIADNLSALAAQPGGGREQQERRDALLAYQKNGAAWVQSTIRAWSNAQASRSAVVPARLADTDKLELMGDEVVENRILASRLALRLLDFASWELNDLRLRVQSLEGLSELHKQDIFRPEVLAQHLIEQWAHVSLPQSAWLMVQDLVQKSMAESMLDIYHATNEFLVRQGVMVEIDLRPLVKRTPSAVTTNSPASGHGGPESLRGQVGSKAAPLSDFGRSQVSGMGAASGTGSPYNGGDIRSGVSSAAMAVNRGKETAAQTSGNWGSDHPVYDETRMETATSPLARVRMRAQGVMGHLKRLLSSQVSDFEETRANPVSPQLEQAMVSVLRAEDSGAESPTVLADAQGQAYGQTHVDQAMGALRKRTSALKQAASSTSEKATIEIVALMFQSILAEDRIPAVIRVWFARLQMPVLRVAISEPEFFGSLQHPARRLIDRMGSCVLGFDVTVAGGILESEIKRVVQVIEQYPETGRRVFQLVYDEFDKFLSKFLSEQGSAARVVSVAQQIEQKETMVIQYTIEMRNMLNDMPVRDDIREFLFKIWAEVLAIAAMKNGPQHAETLMFKRAAADLVWAASAKPNRSDRARVIADLPKLLQLLRLGMSMLGLGVPVQDGHLKVISDTLADAFMSKTDAISLERVEAMAQRLTNLEDYLSDEDVGDLPLDTDSLVTMIGIDAADIEVIADGGSQPTAAMRAWAKELQLGTWFSLDHNGQISHVQFAWCSDRQQLHLFAAADGRNFLIQARRLAAYLQAGLLVPTEEEALTVRATRDALAKLDANPERLLG